MLWDLVASPLTGVLQQQQQPQQPQQQLPQQQQQQQQTPFEGGPVDGVAVAMAQAAVHAMQVGFKCCNSV
jgi:hypothetical protein